MSDDAFTLTGEQVRAWLPPRPSDGHKGTFGHVCVLAGARGFAGAARLTSEGAYRAGAGLVSVGTPQDAWPAVAAGRAEVMVHPLPQTETGALSQAALVPALDLAGGKDAVALGPGLTQHGETAAFVHGFVESAKVPLVADADALNVLASRLELVKHRAAPTVLTPHPGEMARLSGETTDAIQRNRKEAARRFAHERGCVLVLKGAGTIVAGLDGFAAFNATGNPGMGTGGTGDVLTGLIAGLLAQGLGPFEAACVGVYIHGLAGDLAAAQRSMRGLMAGDVLDCVPEAWRQLEGDSDSPAWS